MSSSSSFLPSLHHWYEILAMAFADDSRYCISPHPSSDSSLQVLFSDDQNQSSLVLWLQSHPAHILQLPAQRLRIDQEMRSILSDHLPRVLLPTFHAINTCGPRMSFYMVDCASRRILPRFQGSPITDHALPDNHLIHLWASELGTSTGEETLFSLISNIRSMVLKTQKLRPTIPSSLPSNNSPPSTVPVRPSTSLERSPTCFSVAPPIINSHHRSQPMPGLRAKCSHSNGPYHNTPSKTCNRFVTPCRPIDSTESTRGNRSPHLIHHADCDMCSKHIRGIRWKCLDCVDWDSCEDCYPNVQAIHPFHRLVPIKDPDLLPAVLPAQYLKSHPGISCDACHQSILGIRYKCSHPNCPNYNLCSRCESSPIPKHDIDHAMLKIRDSQAWESCDLAFKSPITNKAIPLSDSRSPTEISIDLTETQSVTPTSSVRLYQPKDRPIASATSTPRPGADTKVASDSNSETNKVPTPITDQDSLAKPPIVSTHSIHPFHSFPARSVGTCLLSSFQPEQSGWFTSSRYILGEPKTMSHLASDPLQSSTAALPGAFPKESGNPTFLGTAVSFPTLDSSPQFKNNSEPSQDQVLITPTHQCNDDVDRSGPQYGASFVSDLTLPDDTCVSVGSHLTKVWLVRNTGYERWPLGTRICLSGGFQHSCPRSYSVPTADPNEVVEVSIETIVPDQPGGYMQVWRFLKPDGNKFGDRLWMSLEAISEDQVNVDDGVQHSSSMFSTSNSFLLPRMNLSNDEQHQCHLTDEIRSISEDFSADQSTTHHDDRQSITSSVTSREVIEQEEDGSNVIDQDSSNRRSRFDLDNLSYRSNNRQSNSSSHQDHDGSDGFEFITDSDPLSPL